MFSITTNILFCCRISENRPLLTAESPLICLLSHPYCCCHGNLLVSMATGISSFCSHPLWTFLAHLSPINGIFENRERFFHHHSNHYQGNQKSVFFLSLRSHGPSSYQLSSRSVQNWGKNNVTPVMFRTPEQYIYDGIIHQG